MSYKIVIDKPQCVGHARCAHFAPHLYKLDDAGYIEQDGFDVPEGAPAATVKAVIESVYDSIIHDIAATASRRASAGRG